MLRPEGTIAIPSLEIDAGVDVPASRWRTVTSRCPRSKLVRPDSRLRFLSGFHGHDFTGIGLIVRAQDQVIAGDFHIFHSAVAIFALPRTC